MQGKLGKSGDTLTNGSCIAGVNKPRDSTRITQGFLGLTRD
ncbi:hypothetical protein C5S31_12380 [ANME-1 cluster archaeon GoMg2]|nr:hypothetical protein [ANME-1 cluster archaeon GoMg2]